LIEELADDPSQAPVRSQPAAGAQDAASALKGIDQRPQPLVGGRLNGGRLNGGRLNGGRLLDKLLHGHVSYQKRGRAAAAGRGAQLIALPRGPDRDAWTS
jgi:hypothetical protein